MIDTIPNNIIIFLTTEFALVYYYGSGRGNLLYFPVKNIIIFLINFSLPAFSQQHPVIFPVKNIIIFLSGRTVPNGCSEKNIFSKNVLTFDYRYEIITLSKRTRTLKNTI